MLFKPGDCEIIEDCAGKTHGGLGEIVTVSVKHIPSGIFEEDSVDVDGLQKDSQANALRIAVIAAVKTQVEALS